MKNLWTKLTLVVLAASALSNVAHASQSFNTQWNHLKNVASFKLAKACCWGKHIFTSPVVQVAVLAAVGAIPGALIGRTMGKERAEGVNTFFARIYNRWGAVYPNVKQAPFSGKDARQQQISGSITFFAQFKEQEDVVAKLHAIQSLLEKVTTDDETDANTKAYQAACDELNTYIENTKQDFADGQRCADSKRRIKSYARAYATAGAVIGSVATVATAAATIWVSNNRKAIAKK